VPEVTLLFWVVKILSTTVGMTATDFLVGTLGLGLAATTATVSILCSIALITQFSLRRYVPVAYWLSVVMISLVGTLLSDDLVDGIRISLWTTTWIFAFGLATTSAAWYRSEHTLSIHTVVTRRREAYYWVAVLFSFALGTSASDLLSSMPTLDTSSSLAIFGAVLGAITICYRSGLSAVAAFWAAYVVTRPFGASLGDVLTAKPADGGLGLGTANTTAACLVVILALVAWFMALEHRRTAVFSVASGGRAQAGPTAGI
jgi:uncharacterized membrane-anchored protein